MSTRSNGAYFPLEWKEIQEDIMNTLSEKQLRELWDVLCDFNTYLSFLVMLEDPLKEKLGHLYTEVDTLLDEIDERLGGE